MCLAVILTAAGAVGCGSAIPPTYPIKGRASYRNGQPVSKGTIEFQSQENSAVRAAGEIGSDGTFSVRTFLEAHEAAGAVAGPHRVIVEPANLRPGEPPIVLPEPIIVEPRENVIELRVDRPPRG